MQSTCVVPMKRDAAEGGVNVEGVVSEAHKGLRVRLSAAHEPQPGDSPDRVSV